MPVPKVGDVHYPDDCIRKFQWECDMDLSRLSLEIGIKVHCGMFGDYPKTLIVPEEDMQAAVEILCMMMRPHVDYYGTSMNFRRLELMVLRDMPSYSWMLASRGGVSYSVGA